MEGADDSFQIDEDAMEEAEEGAAVDAPRSVLQSAHCSTVDGQID